MSWEGQGRGKIPPRSGAVGGRGAEGEICRQVGRHCHSVDTSQEPKLVFPSSYSWGLWKTAWMGPLWHSQRVPSVPARGSPLPIQRIHPPHDRLLTLEQKREEGLLQNLQLQTPRERPGTELSGTHPLKSMSIITPDTRCCVCWLTCVTSVTSTKK